MMSTKLYRNYLLCFLYFAPLAVLSQVNIDRDTALAKKAQIALERSQAGIAKTQNSIRSLITRTERKRQKLEHKLFLSRQANVDTSVLHNYDLVELVQSIKIGKGVNSRSNLMYLKRLDTLKMLANYFSISNQTTLLAEEVQSTLSEFSDYNSIISSRLTVLNTIQSKYSKLGQKELKVIRKLRENLTMCQMQMENFKRTLDNPEQLEQQLLNLLSNSSRWRNFASRNSELSRFFSSAGQPASIQMQSLQTSEDVVKNIESKFGENGKSKSNNTTGYPAIVRKQLNSRPSMPHYSSFTTAILPAFTSKTSFGNEQLVNDLPTENAENRNRSFWKRIELGWNFQTRSQDAATNLKTHALGLSVGYKVTGSFIVGIGAAQEIVSQLPKTLSFSNVGTSIRAYLDGKISGNWWLTTAYEINNISRANRSSLQADSDYSTFLLGLTRRVNIGNKSSKLQLLVDVDKIRNGFALSDALLLRIGRNF